MKPNEIIIHLRDQLSAYVTARKGHISVANNPFEVIELLGQGPLGFNLILHWFGDEDATGQPLAGIVSNEIHAIISAQRGLRMWKGENLHLPSGQIPPLLDIVSEVRAKIREINFPPEHSDQHALYLGCQPEITPEGYPLDAYRLRFSLRTVVQVQF